MSDLEKKRILIVEDDAHLIEMMRGYFEFYAEYEIHAAMKGEEGLARAREIQPDLVLQDIRLPDIDGFEVVRRLRGGGRRTEKIPVIFLTERQERRDRLMGLELGAVDYITKPFDMQELRLRMRNVLRRAGYKSLVNAVTNLPEGEPVRERLLEMLRGEDWGLVLAGLRGLHHFRDRYGFVASDDVARAAGIMVASAARRAGQPEVFVGHLDTADFILVTTADCAADMAAQVEEYLAAAVPQFYPAVDREKWRQKKDPDQLAYQMTVLTARDGACRSLDDLRTRLHGHQPPTPDSQLPTAIP